MEEQKEAVIVEGTHIEGKISGTENVKVEGKISGEVEIDKNILVCQDGTSETNIKAKAVTVEGTHTGNINAADSIQITPSGKVKADLAAPAISIEKGAKFSGKIDMYDEE